MKNIAKFTMLLALALSFSAVGVLAFGGNTVGKNKNVTVVLIKAQWCTACQKVDPLVQDLMKEYGNRINFVMLDVTNDESTAQAAETANSLGLSKFFEENKKLTATVAVFKSGKQTFVTRKNYNKSDYVSAFDKALK